MDKIQIVLGTLALKDHLSDTRLLYEQSITKTKECAASTTSASTTMERSASLKVVLLTMFDGSSAKAHTFLAECNNYINLS